MLIIKTGSYETSVMIDRFPYYCYKVFLNVINKDAVIFRSEFCENFIFDHLSKNEKGKIKLML